MPDSTPVFPSAAGANSLSPAATCRTRDIKNGRARIYWLAYAAALPASTTSILWLVEDKTAGHSSTAAITQATRGCGTRSSAKSLREAVRRVIAPHLHPDHVGLAAGCAALERAALDDPGA